MKNISENRGDNFEKAWRDAFDGKEMNPSPDLWQNLDRHLANQESKKYRRGIFVYKWIAAASVVIALMVTGIYFYNTRSNDQSSGQAAIRNFENGQGTGDKPAEALTDNLGENTSGTFNTENIDGSTPPVQQKNEETAGGEPRKIASAGASGTVADQSLNKGSNQEGLVNTNSTNPDRAFDGNRHVETYDSSNADQYESAQLLTAIDNQNINPDNINMLVAKGAVLNPFEPEVDQLNIQKVINFEDDPFREKEDEQFEESLWAGINISSGVFDPNFGSTRGGVVVSDAITPGSLNSGGNITQESISQRNSSGQSFTFGFNLGKRIAKKWVVQSGINYLNYSSDGSTNAFYELNNQTRAPATNLFSFNDAANLSLASTSIGFENQFEFLSIPVKAGYILLDKKVSLVLSAGLGTDFFLKNSVSPDNGGLQDFDIKPGDDSPYRSVYFNGLMGTQLRYRFSKHYSFTLEPTYSVAINSFSKSDNDLNSFPNVFRIGVGLKYHFK